VNRERFQQIESIFQAALKRDPSSRPAFLDGACLNDDDLRKEVESLLDAHDEAGSFIHTPALEVAAHLMADEQGDSLTNHSLGHYKILAKIGAGGMGEVYLAQDSKLGRKVALKLLPEYFVNDKDRLTRFIQEARAASALNHPNIITIFDIGQAGSTHFIATEFIEGQTLRHNLTKGLLKMGETLDVAIQSASALAAAHTAGIVHRDIKPENIMLRPDGIVKVLDFGLAKLTEGEGLSTTTDSPTAINLSTNPGVVMGTACYMSPEQARGQRVDARSDVWSLGIVLYEMITGQAPFQGATTIDVIASILERQPAPLTRFAVGTPAQLQWVVSKALRKERDERYQTIKEMLSDLKDLRYELEAQARAEGNWQPRDGYESESAKAASAQQLAAATAQDVVVKTDDLVARHTSSAEVILTEIKKHKAGALITLSILILVSVTLGFGLYRYTRSKIAQPPPTAQAAASGIKLTPFPINGTTEFAVISPDGKYIAYTLLNEAKTESSLWMKHLPTGSTVQILPPSQSICKYLTFSSDSNYLYYQAFSNISFGPPESLSKVPIVGGTPKKLIADLKSGKPISLSPDSKQIAFVREGGSVSKLLVANEDGTDERALVSRSGQEWFSGQAAWSPDGKTIACFTGSYAGGAHLSLAVVQVEDGALREIGTAKWFRGYNLHWLPDGKGLLLTGQETGSAPRQIWQVAYPSGEAKKLTTDLNDNYATSLTADASTLLVGQQKTAMDVWVCPAAGEGKPNQVTFSKADGPALIWAPDGRIVFLSWASGDSQVWVMNADGSDRRQLTSGPSDIRPAVSPDGRYVVFTSMRTGNANLWRVDIDGGNLKQLTSHTSEDNGARYTPDGKWIIFHSWRSGENAIWKMPTEGGEAVQLTGPGVINPEPSPDGKWFACVNRVSANSNRVQIFPIEGGEPVREIALQANYFPPVRWTADGRALTLVVSRDGAENVWKLPLEGGQLTPLTRFKPEPGTEIADYALSHDGKEFAVVRKSSANGVVLITSFN
jgi:serine/threonine protein kinase/Tol biopolymer transport system component